MARDAVAIVLGRAGSKGVPGKNLAPVAGKPCAQWTIEHAIASECVARVVVSSDSEALLALAASLGAESHARPPALATDSARVDDAARAALNAARGLAPGAPVVILYANVPVRPPGLVDRALVLLEESGCDSVQSYARVGKHHPWWTARLDDAGRVRAWEGDVLNHGVFRRQDLPPAFMPDGGVIALTQRALRLEIPGVGAGPHAFFGLDRRGIETREGDVIDIDTPTDLLVADAVLRGRAPGEGLSRADR